MADQTNNAVILPAIGKDFELTTRPVPVPGPDDVLIRTNFAAVNGVDRIRQLYGFQVPTTPKVVGSDVTGTVVSAGANAASTYKVGDRVIAAADGIATGDDDHEAYQNFVAVPTLTTAKLPENLTLLQGSTVSTIALTASHILFDGLKFSLPGAKEQTKPLPAAGSKPILVVWGGASSVGSLTVQLAHKLGFAVFAVASPRHHEKLQKFGAEVTVDYSDPEATVEKLLAAAGQRTISYAADTATDPSKTLPHLENLLLKSAAATSSTAVPDLAYVNFAPEHKWKEGITSQFVNIGSTWSNRKDIAEWLFVSGNLASWLADGTIVPASARVIPGGLGGLKAALNEIQSGLSEAGHLCVADKASLGSVVGVGVGAAETQQSVPRLGSSDVAFAGGDHLGQGGSCGVLGGLIGTANVGQLVVDAVHDDLGVQGLLLASVDKRVDGLESTFARRAAVQASLELHGWHAETKVKARHGGRDEAVKRALHGVGDRTEASGGTGARGLSAGGGHSSRGSGGSASSHGNERSGNAAAVFGRRGNSSNSRSRRAAGSIGSTAGDRGAKARGVRLSTISRNGCEVGKALGDHDLGNTETGSVKGRGLGLCGVGVLQVGAANSRVDQGNDTAQLRADGECRVRADGGNADDEGVKVLLSGNKATGSSHSGIAGAELRQDEISLGQLAAGVGGGQKELDGGTGQSGGLAGLAKISEGANGSNSTVAFFLAEAGLDSRSKDQSRHEARHHFEARWCL
ncbi:hypothetical protein SPBR_06640 [Sporothrix brasiliensis 5110]|uniref:Enoyl reductase (ER) domain-containing protein n=1 Tax=Sporothrix brasiliensis 5110 TaxID=1398154 RepID=A0A0C2EQ34_9PEZI|nr:uncharacterized protein SPBR_06640 [Sporothrix brasiliensis 5110]KIH88424.1 hypothetical protein SPBR_06640 [Sporothrix brasiliensis 5110]